MDFHTARHNMLASQIRTWNVFDPQILDLLEQLHREDFLPEAYRTFACADTFLPIGHGQTTLTPALEAYMLQALAPKPQDRVLEVGCGCGYFTALLAQAAGTVISVDCFADLLQAAEQKLRAQQISNVQLVHGNAGSGWEPEAPYDVIAMTGALPEPDSAIERQLRIGGRACIFTGRTPPMQLRHITRLDKNTFRREILLEITVPPLLQLQERFKFVF